MCKFLSFLLILTLSCSQQEIDINEKLSDNWIVFGHINDPTFFAKEVLALGMDGTRYRSTLQGENFSLRLPGNALYAFYILPDPTHSKLSAAVLTFDEGRKMGQSNTLRLPKPRQSSLLDLGLIDIKNNEAWPMRNPSRFLDFDEDGLPDNIDPDDHNDGLKDYTQKWENEKVGLCHRDKNHESYKEFPLATLLSHLLHGDTIGRCAPKKL
jgi:hypothetical protein